MNAAAAVMPKDGVRSACGALRAQAQITAMQGQPTRVVRSTPSHALARHASQTERRDRDSGAIRSDHWHAAYATQRGARHRLRHQSNQDALGVRAFDNGTLVAAVADGVGQGARGDIAAQALVQHWLDAPYGEAAPPEPAWLGAADDAVNVALARATTYRGAATGAAVWLDQSGHGWATRIGDCRIYLLTPEAAELSGFSWQLLLSDQSYANMDETPPGNSAKHHPARMAGTGCVGKPEVVALAVPPRGAVLLCSDGVHHGGDDADFFLQNAQQIWAATREHGLESKALQLLPDGSTSNAAMAHEADDADDATAVLIWRARV